MEIPLSNEAFDIAALKAIDAYRLGMENHYAATAREATSRTIRLIPLLRSEAQTKAARDLMKYYDDVTGKRELYRVDPILMSYGTLSYRIEVVVEGMCDLVKSLHKNDKLKIEAATQTMDFVEMQIEALCNTLGSHPRDLDIFLRNGSSDASMIVNCILQKTTNLVADLETDPATQSYITARLLSLAEPSSQAMTGLNEYLRLGATYRVGHIQGLSAALEHYQDDIAWAARELMERRTPETREYKFAPAEKGVELHIRRTGEIRAERVVPDLGEGFVRLDDSEVSPRAEREPAPNAPRFADAVSRLSMTMNALPRAA